MLPPLIRMKRRGFGFLLAAGLGSGAFGCSAIYPEVATPVRPPNSLSSSQGEQPPPEDLYFLYFEGATVPPRTRDGREWEGGGPDTYAKLLWGEREILKTPVEPGTRKPTWPNQEKVNYRIPDGAELTVELWHDDPIRDHPLCQVAVLDLKHLRAGGRSDFYCDSGARVTLGVEPARPVMGLGFYYELRGAEGVRITRVVEHSPAKRAGLDKGDQILTLGGKPVKEMDALAIRSTINAKSREGLKMKVKLSEGGVKNLGLKEGPIYPLPEDGIELTKD